LKIGDSTGIFLDLDNKENTVSGGPPHGRLPLQKPVFNSFGVLV